MTALDIQAQELRRQADTERRQGRVLEAVQLQDEADRLLAEVTAARKLHRFHSRRFENVRQAELLAKAIAEDVGGAWRAFDFDGCWEIEVIGAGQIWWWCFSYNDEPDFIGWSDGEEAVSFERKAWE